MGKYGFVLLGSVLTMPVFAIEAEWHGLVDARAVASDSQQSWLYEGLDKQRFDQDHQGLQLGQAVLTGRVQLADTLSAQAWLNGYDHRNYGAGVGEAFVQWKPLPSSAWRWRAKAGLFFPELSLENSGLGWTSDYLISSSAINTWVGEELRTLGTEWGFRYNGALVGSSHDWQMNIGAFRWNDPAGGLLAWRGWSVGDRVTASHERVPFPALTVFAPNGYWAGQIQGIEPFREIDGKTGYYLNAAYHYLDNLTVTVMHYDNRGNPKAFVDGQWAWDTSFNHLGIRWQQAAWTVMGQVMSGRTIMGYTPQHDLIADFAAWYGLASYQWQKQRVSARYDRFWLSDRDGKVADPNGEYGSAIAVAWNWQCWPQADVGVEYLRITSDRDARQLLQQNTDQQENLWQGRIRWWF